MRTGVLAAMKTFCWWNIGVFRELWEAILGKYEIEKSIEDVFMLPSFHLVKDSCTPILVCWLSKDWASQPTRASPGYPPWHSWELMENQTVSASDIIYLPIQPTAPPTIPGLRLTPRWKGVFLSKQRESVGFLHIPSILDRRACILSNGERHIIALMPMGTPPRSVTLLMFSRATLEVKYTIGLSGRWIGA